MSKKIYKKETFIFEKNNSITTELCNDIIDLYDINKYDIIDLYDINKYDIIDLYDINKYDNYDKFINAKVTKFLHNELKANLCKYRKSLNKINNYNIINIKNLKCSLFIKKIKLINETIYTKRFSETNNIKIFMYIWFLNDYDGEIIFWNDYRITPKCGKFIVFPVSWCFPYHEIIRSDANKYILYGYICI